MCYEDLSRSVPVYEITCDWRQLLALNRHVIAEKFRCNPNYLSQRFKDITGRTITNFINFEKMKRVEKLFLKDTSLSVTRISQMVGYSKYSRFGKSFRNVFGLNPSLYKKIVARPETVGTVKSRDLSESMAIYIVTLKLQQLIGLTREDLAEHFGLNAKYISRIFKQGVEKTLFQFIEFEKLKRAELLLITRCDLSIGEISRAVGINGYKRFREKFQAIYGLNPCDYRLLHVN